MRLAPTHEMRHDQDILQGADEDSDEEFPSLLEVSTLLRESKKGETFDTFWDRWERMREREKDKRSDLSVIGSTLTTINRERRPNLPEYSWTR